VTRAATPPSEILIYDRQNAMQKANGTRTGGAIVREMTNKNQSNTRVCGPLRHTPALLRPFSALLGRELIKGLNV
jgi:hypothetical protein